MMRKTILGIKKIANYPLNRLKKPLPLGNDVITIKKSYKNLTDHSLQKIYKRNKDNGNFEKYINAKKELESRGYKLD